MAMSRATCALFTGAVLLGLSGAAAQSAYDAVVSGLTSDLSSYFSPSYTASAPSTLSSLLDTYTSAAPAADPETQFCAPATLVPAEVTPAVLLGPTMTVTLTTGSCSVAKDGNATGALLATCQAPAITWVKTPITYVKPFTSGAVFTSEECIEGKNLTAGSSQVLWSGGDPTTYASPSTWLSSYQSGAYSFGMTPNTVAAEPVVVPVAAAAPAALPASTAAAAAAAGATAAGAAGR